MKTHPKWSNVAKRENQSAYLSSSSSIKNLSVPVLHQEFVGAYADKLLVGATLLSSGRAAPDEIRRFERMVHPPLNRRAYTVAA